MKVFIIVTAIILLLTIAFILLTKSLYTRDLKKDKYDVLDYLKNHRDTMSITINENGIDTLTINSNKRFPLASTLKIIVAYNFLKSVTNN